MTFRLPNKHPAENKLLVLPFDGDIARGQTITGFAVLSVTMDAGVDPSPTLVVNGAGVIDNVERRVLLSVHDGLDGCDYFFTTKATDNTGHEHVLQFVLPVRSRIKR